ncbi:Ltp family lipoprotein [Amycolatopsis sp. NPDC051128]|uniref:Ltp family lipoprotein n=1 Tax=Amycolatopsis sp. NPDC051128 TaxID=3155412 RepID=UPI00341960A5
MNYHPPSQHYPSAPVGPPVKKSKLKGVAVTALVLGLVALCLSPVPFLNNAGFFAGAIGSVFAFVALFGTHKAMALISFVLAVGGITATIAFQAAWAESFEETFGSSSTGAMTTTSQSIPLLSTTVASAPPTTTPLTTTPVVPSLETTPVATSQYPPQVEQARSSAQSYLDFAGFSRAGLIGQLSSQYGAGFPKNIATQAVDSLSVDWNAQAVRSAQSYLDYTSFSCSGLTQQLSSPYGGEFTKSQATYGARQTRACK